MLKKAVFLFANMTFANLLSTSIFSDIRDLKFYCKDARIVEFAIKGKRAQGKKLSLAERQDLVKIKAAKRFVKQQSEILFAIQIDRDINNFCRTYINRTNPSDMR